MRLIARSPVPTALDVTRGDAEVRAALAGHPVPPASELDEELIRYARFRGAQARLGRNWRDWPSAARAGTLTTIRWIPRRCASTS